MATFKAVRNKRQVKSGLIGTAVYITDLEKTMHGGKRLATGHNCVLQNSVVEMLATKALHRKTDGRQYYHFVQSFPTDEQVSPKEVHRIGMEFAQKQFPDFEVIVATHTDTEHLHNHFLVNSVSFVTGKKLHQSRQDLIDHRRVNDEICADHGLQVLEPYDPARKKKGLKRGEIEAAKRGRSWKFDLMKSIDEALSYSPDRESFLQNLAYDGYEVAWSDRKYITFTCPNGEKIRDRSLPDETYRKENLEKLFAYRAENGFTPQTPEPDGGWLSLVDPTGSEDGIRQKRREYLQQLANQQTETHQQNLQ